ncbi:GNAT family N-acetyltransferase [Flagellimonas flava]|uniref:Acetyltransferase (GNAT) family protein n=1 Tax=Flagellimonas flava TaxID=570519 RepID=A0A1M5KZQ4_9FLAO|nr:GNAT family N-acetyltransferase [Allomuricauda flava]SHG57643.1 Acetyltransferase (GNAT) family protein [Allomuricauda flava]
MESLNKDIVHHLFSFWSEIGVNGGFTFEEKGYTATLAPSFSWPSKIFFLNSQKIDFSRLFQDMKDGVLPNSLSIMDSPKLANELKRFGFQKTSLVKAMCLEVPKIPFQEVQNDITVVASSKHAQEFAEVASKAFGYNILGGTIEPLLNNNRFRLYLGKQDGLYASCGIVYFDTSGNAGIHMIGVPKAHRGLGLGKTMAQHLISVASNAATKKVYLVASKMGERIYAGMGFEAYGSLLSFKAH